MNLKPGPIGPGFFLLWKTAFKHQTLMPSRQAVEKLLVQEI
jgi:hypothetical protein